MEIIERIVPQSKWDIKCPYYMNPTRIVVHNTANDASAANEISYMTNNNNYTSFHYAVDDIQTIQGIPENRNAWHAGDGAGIGNMQGIAIEICYSRSGGDKFIQAEKNAVVLIVDILRRYGWGIAQVTKHQDYMDKYCPHRTLDMGWQRFLDMVSLELSKEDEVKITLEQLRSNFRTIYNIVASDSELNGTGFVGQDYASVTEQMKAYIVNSGQDYRTFYNNATEYTIKQKDKITELTKQLADCQNQPPKEVTKEIPVEKIVTVVKEVPTELDKLTLGELISAAFKKLLNIK